MIVSKFGDHLPLYRLEDILTRYGVYISRSTLCDWVKSTAELFRPLYELQRELVLQSSVMWTDDTPITVLGGREGSFKGHFWTYIGDEHILTPCTTSPPVAVVTVRRVFCRVIQATCMRMRIRVTTRCFWTSDRVSSKLPVGRMRGESSSMRVKSYPRESHQVLEWIRQLYDIEDRAHEWSVDARRELRAA